MPADDIFELNVDMVWGGQNCVNVHHFIQIGDDGTGAWQAALLSVWEDNYQVPLLACMVTAVEIVQIRMRRLLPTQTQQTITAKSLNGAILAIGVPTHCAALLRQRGFPTGPKGTGGVKICGTPSGEVLNGRLTVAHAALIQTYGDISEATITDGGTGYKFRSGVLSQVDDSFRAIEKSKVTPRVVTVHSRQKGVGQ